MDLINLYNFLNNLGLYIKDHKDLLYTFITILGAFLIPLIISFFDGVNRKGNFKELNLLFFKKSFNIIEIIFWFFFSFIILLFWNNNYGYFINIIILICLYYPVYKILIKIKTISEFDRFLNSEIEDNIKKKKLILEKLSVNDKDLYIWEDTLKSDFGKNFVFFKDIINILIDKIKKDLLKFKDKKASLVKVLLERKNSKLLSIYLNIDNDISQNAFLWNTESNFKTFLNLKYELSKGKNKYYEINTIINNIIKIKLEKLLEGEHGVWVFYKVLKEHIEENKSDNNYVSSFVSDILNIFLNSDLILENRDIVKKFPYKITLSIFKDKNSSNDDRKIQGLIFDRILQYIINNIQEHYLDEKIELNNKISNIINYWFGEFSDIITLSDVLYMLFVPYGESRAEGIINGKRTFGHIGRVRTMSNKELSKNNLNGYVNTINKIKNLLGFLYNKKDLEKLLNEFNEIIIENKLEKNKLLRATKYKKFIEDLLK